MPRSPARWVTVLVLGTLLRLVYVPHGHDHWSIHSWREADYVQVTRNFHREDANPLHPRVDWRGNTDGRVEMELPVLPYAASLLYRVFGEHPVFLRILSALCAIGSLLVFCRLAREHLPDRAAWWATAAFAGNGLAMSLSGAMQPESLMLLLTCTAALHLLRWVRGGPDRALVAAGAWTGAAILAKGPAVHLGLVFAWACLRRHGARALARPVVHLTAAVALVPPLLWYLHAHGMYEETGLSLGLSNEAHLLNIDLLMNPCSTVVNNARFEVTCVFGGIGVLWAAAAVWWRRSRAVPELAWYGAAVVFYVITANTSGDDWAYYYHVLSVAPACLLMGGGIHALLDARRAWRVATLASGGITLALVLLPGPRLLWSSWENPIRREHHRCVLELAGHVPEGARIVVRGGKAFDWTGRRVAYNRSMAFAWMDRRGVNYPIEEATPGTLERLARAGNRYWLAGPDDLTDPELARAARERYRLVASCGDYRLYDLGGR